MRRYLKEIILSFADDICNFIPIYVVIRASNVAHEPKNADQ